MQSVVNQFRFLIPLLVVTMSFPFSPTFAASPVDAAVKARPATAVVDVTLTADGLLPGQLLSAAGQPMAGAKVRLHNGHGAPIEATTSSRGAFAYRNLSTGVYYLQAGDHVCMARVWTATTAPPKAQKSVLLIGQTQTMRGQMGPPPRANGFAQNSRRILTNPLAVAGIVATAVAIPVAIHNSDSSS